MELTQEKQKLRTQLAAQMTALEAEYRKNADKKIFDTIAGLPMWAASQTVFVYISVANEPDTRRLIALALQQGKRVCVPRCGGPGAMHARQLLHMNELHIGAYGIPEPDATAPLVLPEELDLVIVPCLACDKQGNRLGHGAGYYDRYLKQTSAHKVCLCYGSMLQQALPVTTHDVAMDLVFTEDSCYGRLCSQ